MAPFTARSRLSISSVLTNLDGGAARGYAGIPQVGERERHLKGVRFRDDVPPYAPLASLVWDPGSSVRMPQNAPTSVPSTPTPFRCTTIGTSIVPLSRLQSVWRRGSCCPACLAGSHAQFDSASSTAFSRRRWQSGTPLSCARRLLSSWQRMQSSRSLQPR